MALQKQVLVSVVISGEVFKQHPLSTHGMKKIEDLRFAPFPLAKGQEVFYIPSETVTVQVRRWFGPKMLFDNLRLQWNRSLPKSRDNSKNAEWHIQAVNAWLAIVDHFGLEAEYEPKFIGKIDNIVSPILDQAYGVNSSIDNARYIHGRTYTSHDFRMIFRAFLRKYDIKDRSAGK